METPTVLSPTSSPTMLPFDEIMSETFMKLFDEYRIEYRDGKELKEQILQIKEYHS